MIRSRSNLSVSAGATYSIDVSNNAYIADVLHRGLMVSRYVSPSLRRTLKTGPALLTAKPRCHRVDEQASKSF